MSRKFFVFYSSANPAERGGLYLLPSSDKAKICGLFLRDYISSSLDRDVAQPGRALRSGRRSREFKSRHPDHFLFSRLQKPSGK